MPWKLRFKKQLYQSTNIFLIIIIFLFLFTDCKKSSTVNPTEPEVNKEIIEKPDPLRILAQEIALSLDDSLLTAQVLISGIDGRGEIPLYMKKILEESPVGGVMLFSYNLNTGNDEIRSFVDQTVTLITEKASIPPFIAVDHEGGTVYRFLRGVASLPSADSYQKILQEEGEEAALIKIKEDSFKAGSEIKSLGINMNFAPVAEPLIDENRIFLEKRSYGPDAIFTSLAADAFVQGMKQAGVLCVIKHFPASAGHDPHFSASIINMEKPELDNLIYPFSYLIKNGARAVMASHTKVPFIDSEIASLSSVVMNSWLRGELAFEGLIISDDFTMTAAQQLKQETAAVRSVSAGADAVLVWPPDIKRTHAAFLSALENGSLSRERLLDAVEKIIYEKLLMGIHDPQINTEPQPSVLQMREKDIAD